MRPWEGAKTGSGVVSIHAIDKFQSWVILTNGTQFSQPVVLKFCSLGLTFIFGSRHGIHGYTIRLNGLVRFPVSTELRSLTPIQRIDCTFIAT